MIKIVKIIGVYLQIFILLGCVSNVKANDSGCPFPNSRNETLDDIINHSNTIALYTATTEYKTSTIIIGSDNVPTQTAQIRLNLSATLKGDPPIFKTVTTHPLPEYLPPMYFSLMQYHADIINGKRPLFGSNLDHVSTKAGDCINLPTLIPGYHYLVFDDELSILSFEPVLSTMYDPLYDELIKRARAQSKH